MVNDIRKRRDIAMVFQTTRLPTRWLFMKMVLVLNFVNIKKDDRQTHYCVKLLLTFELTEFLDRKPADLSGDQRQRARDDAIVHDAKVFLMVNLSVKRILNLVSLCVLKLLNYS